MKEVGDHLPVKPLQELQLVRLQKILTFEQVQISTYVERIHDIQCPSYR